MNKREEISRKWVMHGDEWSNEVVPKYYKYLQRKPKMSPEQQLLESNKLAVEIALVCEFYCKGIIMQDAQIILPQSVIDCIRNRCLNRR